MKKITVRVHTTDAEHWVTMNGAAVLVDGTEGGGFTVKGGGGFNPFDERIRVAEARHQKLSGM